MANVHNPKTIAIQYGCDCGWEGEVRTSRSEAENDFTKHFVEQIHKTRSPSWAAKHPETGGNNE